MNSEQKLQEDGSWKRKRSIQASSIISISESAIAHNHLFYSHNWAAGMLTDNKKNVPGLMINQACTTSTTILNLLAKDIELGVYDVGFGLMADRAPTARTPSGRTRWARVAK